MLLVAHGPEQGPVEKEVERRLDAGLPMTALQLTAYAEAAYPVEVRAFLNSLGYQRLYEEDLARAVERQSAVPATSIQDQAAKAFVTTETAPDSPRPRIERRRSGGVVPIVTVAVAIAIAGSVAVLVSLPRPRADLLVPTPQAKVQAKAQAPQASPEHSVEALRCRQALRDTALAWCVTALTGEDRQPASGDQGFERTACGDPIAIKAETLRRALDGIMDDDALYSYAAADAARRCQTAASGVILP